jgi:hypothetical protein
VTNIDMGPPTLRGLTPRLYREHARYRLKAAGISFVELECVLGVPASTVSAWLNPRLVEMRLTTIARIEAAIQTILSNRKESPE